jgi:hypothetical protein
VVFVVGIEGDFFIRVLVLLEELRSPILSLERSFRLPVFPRFAFGRRR